MGLVKVTLLQMTAFGYDQQANLANGEVFCRRAKERGADIALFPEVCNITYTFPDSPESEANETWRAPAVGRQDRFVTHFKALAKELNMSMILTHLERRDGAPRNSLSLVDCHGGDPDDLRQGSRLRFREGSCPHSRRGSPRV